MQIQKSSSSTLCGIKNFLLTHLFVQDPDVLTEVFRNLQLPDLLKCGTLSKEWKALTSSFPDWSKFCIEHFFGNKLPSSEAQKEIKENAYSYYLSCLNGTYTIVKELQHSDQEITLEAIGLKASEREVTSMIQNGDWLICGYLDGSISFRDVNSPNKVTHLKHHTSTVNCLQIYKSHLMSNSTDGFVKVYSFKEKEVIKEFQIPNDSYAFDVKLENDTLTAGCEDGNVYVWDYVTEKLKKNQIHNESVTSLYVYEQKIFSGSTDGEIFVWNESNDEENVLDSHASVQWLSASCDHNLISFSIDSEDSNTYLFSWNLENLEKKEEKTLSIDSFKSYIINPSKKSEEKNINKHELLIIPPIDLAGSDCCIQDAIDCSANSSIDCSDNLSIDCTVNSSIGDIWYSNYTLNGTSLEGLKYYCFNGEMIKIDEHGIDLTRKSKHLQKFKSAKLPTTFTTEMIMETFIEQSGKDLYISIPNQKIQHWVRKFPEKLDIKLKKL